MNDLRAHFRPEFLNRLDETIMFRPLTKDNVYSIISLLVNDINKRLADKELRIELTEAAKQLVVEGGYDPTYGARPLKRYLQKNVETEAAKLILEGNVGSGDTILIDNVDGKLTARIKQHLYKESAIGRSSNPIMVTSSGAGRFMTACACIRLELYQTVF